MNKRNISLPKPWNKPVNVNVNVNVNVDNCGCASRPINFKEEEMKILLAKYKRSFKRKFTINQIKKLREKFSGSGNNFFNRKHNDVTKKKLGSYLKKKKAIYDKAIKKIYQDINAKRKGKTWVEIYGLEKATLIAEKAKATREKNKENNKKEKPS